MKMKKGTLKGTLAAVAIVGTTATVFATTSVNVDAQQSTQGNPTVTSQERSQNNFEVVHLKEWNGFPFAEPSQNDISAQEAGEIAANSIEQLFDVSLEGATIYMSFVDNSIESQASATDGIDIIYTQMPNMWNGTIMPNGADINSGMFEYRFSVNSETGEFISVSFMPDAAATIGVESPGDNVMSVGVVPNQQHNYEFSHYAMQVVEERNILDSEITRARISYATTWFRGWEQVEAIAVWVQSINGENVELTFTGFLEDEKELVNVRFLGVEEPYLQDMIEVDAQGNVINNNGPHNWVTR